MLPDLQILYGKILTKIYKDDAPIGSFVFQTSSPRS